MTNPNLNLLTTLKRRKEEVMKNFYPYLLRSVSRSTVVIVIFSLLVGLAAAVDPPPEFLAEWGSYGLADGQFRYPHGVAVDSTGNVYVVDTDNNRIQKFDADGTFLTTWGSYGMGGGRFCYPRGVAVDGEGNIYVADMYNHRIQKFDADGNLLTKWGSYGLGNGRFRYPYGVAVDSEDNIYVADMYNNRIQKFDADGNFLTKWGSIGSGDAQFRYPRGIAVDGEDNIYVADMFNYRIQKFDPDGNFLTKWGSQGRGDGQFYRPYGVAVDGVDNVYVADSYNHRIQKFDAEGNFLTKWGSHGRGDSRFSCPYGVAVDNSGNVYVTDSYNHRIQKFGNSSIQVEIDIKPGSDSNPLNVKSKGVLPVAILGSNPLDLANIDTTTIRLSRDGFEEEDDPRPIRWNYEDVLTSSEAELYDHYHERDAVGHTDLTLKFRMQAIVEAIGHVIDGEEVVLTIRGNLFDGTQFEGKDSVRIIKKGKNSLEGELLDCQ
jgi:DNA-binding beta-propeller fold protein YncE